MIESPCTNVCTLEPRTGFCLGCGRTIHEIAHWTTMSAAERNHVLSELPARLAARKSDKARTATG